MSAKPLDTTHALLFAAADLLQSHEAQRLAEKIRAYAERNIPDMPFGEEDRKWEAYSTSRLHIIDEVRDATIEECTKVLVALPVDKARCRELHLPEQAWKEALDAAIDAIRALKADKGKT
jgi:hypothetical protein